MKKSLAALAVGAAALVAVPVVAGAQEADSTDSTITDDTTRTFEHGRFADSGDGFRGHGGRHGQGFGNLDSLTEVLGMSEDELRTALADGQSLSDIAAAQNVSVDSVVDVLVAAAEEHLAEAVTDEHLTQAEAEEKLADIEARITERVNAVHEMPAGRGERGMRGFGGFGDLTELLGIEATDLFEALRDGSTLGEVAEANGVSTDELRSTMLEGLEAHLAEAVTDERITQDQADEMLSNAGEHIDDIINGELPARPDVRRGHHGQFDSDDVSDVEVEELSLSA